MVSTQRGCVLIVFMLCGQRMEAERYGGSEIQRPRGTEATRYEGSEVRRQ